MVDGDVGGQVARTTVGGHHIDHRGLHRDAALRHLVEHRGSGHHLAHRCALEAGVRGDRRLGGAVGEADTVLYDRHTGFGKQHRARHAARLELGEPAAQAILGSVIERDLGHVTSMVVRGRVAPSI